MKKQRDFYFDNAKFLLIFLVVFGHFLQSFTENNQVINQLYLLIYSFHMPAFIFVSGIFAKGVYQKEYYKKLVKKLIGPYVLFQLIYSLFYYYSNQPNQFHFQLLDPHWSLWFLLSLFFWHFMLLGFARLKPALGMTIALAIGLLVGTIDWISNYLSLSRTFVFFPLFLLGYYLTKDRVKNIAKHAWRVGAGAAVIGVFLFLKFNPGFDVQWFFGSKPYSVMDASAIGGIFTRLGVYSLSIIMVFSFFAFVPKKQYFFTNLGKNTLYVYLLHGFFIQIFRGSEAINYFQQTENYWLLFPIALILTLLLSSKKVITLTEPLIELKMTKLHQALTQRKRLSQQTKQRDEHM